jgi:Ser/Thr protein kinase RdoA (MazF antagonist)
MDGELVLPDWPPLTLEEVSMVLARYPAAGVPEMVTWHSPRPMSAAALVRSSSGVVLVKRHHRSVRSPEQLRAEHRFADHLRGRGMSVPAVRRDRSGAGCVVADPWVYEVQAPAPGEDRYRDVASWEPFASADDARAAGAALAGLHLAASDHRAPRRAWTVLITSCEIADAPDPTRAVRMLAGRRPGLARALDGRAWAHDLTACLGGHLRAAAPHLRRLPPCWAHGDWHPSNLTWSGGGAATRVESVMDLGCANRTSAVHDLAMAVERSIIGWLALPRGGEPEVDWAGLEALLDGYRSVRPLTPVEASALPAVLPVVHLEYALSELEYFASVVENQRNADLAYHGYLLGHARWFSGPRGREMLAHLGRVAATALPATATSPFPGPPGGAPAGGGSPPPPDPSPAGPAPARRGG